MLLDDRIHFEGEKYTSWFALYLNNIRITIFWLQVACLFDTPIDSLASVLYVDYVVYMHAVYSALCIYMERKICVEAVRENAFLDCHSHFLVGFLLAAKISYVFSYITSWHEIEKFFEYVF